MNKKWRERLIAWAIFVVAGALGVLAWCEVIALCPGYIAPGNPLPVLETFWRWPGPGGKLFLITAGAICGLFCSQWYLRRALLRKIISRLAR